MDSCSTRPGQAKKRGQSFEAMCLKFVPTIWRSVSFFSFVVPSSACLLAGRNGRKATRRIPESTVAAFSERQMANYITVDTQTAAAV